MTSDLLVTQAEALEAMAAALRATARELATPTPEWMSVDEAADWLRVSPSTVRRLAATGRIEATKHFNTWRIRRTP